MYRENGRALTRWNRGRSQDVLADIALSHPQRKLPRRTGTWQDYSVN